MGGLARFWMGLAVIVLVGALLLGGAAPAPAMPPAGEQADLATGWQVSAPRPGLDAPAPGGVVELGLRQRNADLSDHFQARVEVTDPRGITTVGAMTLTGDAWTFLAYPTAMAAAAPTVAGAYYVRYVINEQFVVTDTFTVG